MKWGIKKADVFLTPEEVFVDIEKDFGLNLRKAYDPCPWPPSDVDGLTADWKSPCYCNPPFSQAVKWYKKAQLEATKGVTTIMLLPWYCWHGSSSCKHLVPRPIPKRRNYKFYSPTLKRYNKGKSKTMGCHLIKICKK